ncbi:hypothetical protein D3C75_973580 [compost metagenome]
MRRAPRYRQNPGLPRTLADHELFLCAVKLCVHQRAAYGRVRDDYRDQHLPVPGGGLLTDLPVPARQQPACEDPGPAGPQLDHDQKNHVHRPAVCGGADVLQRRQDSDANLHCQSRHLCDCHECDFFLTCRGYADSRQCVVTDPDYGRWPMYGQPEYQGCP